MWAKFERDKRGTAARTTGGGRLGKPGKEMLGNEG